MLAYVGLDLLVGFAGRVTARATEIRIDGGVLAFAMLLSVVAAFVFAFLPPLRSQEAVGSTLTRAGTRSNGGRRRLQRGLIVAQVAASVTVLTAAGLLALAVSPATLVPRPETERLVELVLDRVGHHDRPQPELRPRVRDVRDLLRRVDPPRDREAGVGQVEAGEAVRAVAQHRDVERLEPLERRGDVFVDVENGVNTAIRKLRQALRDSPDAPTFIETVPGKGYRFIAAVERHTSSNQRT